VSIKVLTHQRDDIIEIKPNKKAIKTCLDRGLSTEVIKLRLGGVDLFIAQ
jgi:hypothetical protein